jgi:hypothetical protein
MNAGLSTAGDLLIVPQGRHGAAAPKLAANGETVGFVAARSDNIGHYASAQAKADNIGVHRQRTQREAHQRFRYRLNETSLASPPQEAQKRANSQGADGARQTINKTDPVQLLLKEQAQFVFGGRDGVVGRPAVIWPEAGRASVQVAPNLKIAQNCSVVEKTAKAVAATSAHRASAISLIANKPAQLSPGHGPIATKAVLPGRPEDSILAEIEGTKAPQIRATTVTAERACIVQQNGGESLPAGSGETMTIARGPAISDIEAGSNGRKTSSPNGEGSMLQLAAGGGKTSSVDTEPVVTDKSVILDVQKSHVLDEGLVEGQNRPVGGQPKGLVGSGGAALIAKEQADYSGNNVQQGRVAILQGGTKQSQGQMSSEPSAGGDQGNTADFSAGARFDTLNLSNGQVSAALAQGHRGAKPKNRSASGLDGVLGSANVKTSAADWFSDGSARAMKTSSETSRNGISLGVGEQILSSISSSVRRGEQQIAIHLNPPELGKVSIRFQEQGGQITGLLEVSKIETRYEIEQALPEIIRNLGDCGIQIKRLEVMLADQPEQQAYKDQALPNGWSEQRGSAEANNPHAGGTDTGEWSTNSNTLAGFSEPRGLVTDHSINMLV